MAVCVICSEEEQAMTSDIPLMTRTALRPSTSERRKPKSWSSSGEATNPRTVEVSGGVAQAERRYVLVETAIKLD